MVCPWFTCCQCPAHAANFRGPSAPRLELAGGEWLGRPLEWGPTQRAIIATFVARNVCLAGFMIYNELVVCISQICKTLLLFNYSLLVCNFNLNLYSNVPEQGHISIDLFCYIGIIARQFYKLHFTSLKLLVTSCLMSV